MTTTPTTDRDTEPDTEPDAAPTHDDEIRIGGWGWWAVGGALGTALTTLAAFIVLIQMSGPARDVPEPSPGSAGSPLAEITLVATDFAYDPASSFVTGEVTLTLDNQGGLFHNLVIEGLEDFLLEADPAMTATGTVTLEPGDYVIFCSIPGHRESGMEGELHVLAE